MAEGVSASVERLPRNGGEGKGVFGLRNGSRKLSGWGERGGEKKLLFRALLFSFFSVGVEGKVFVISWRSL